MKTISLDFHDFSVENTNLYYLEKLREMYPKIKISMFYIPADQQYFNRLDQEQKEQSKNMIKIAVAEGWIELIPHGITHMPEEFKNASYEDMLLAMKAYEEHFRVIDCPYVKGFCPPFWQMSTDAIKCLNRKKWFLAVDRNQPNSLRANVNYEYNWDIADQFPKDKEVVKGHGHINIPSRNALIYSLKNLSKIPQDYEWKFVSEMVKEENDKGN